MSIFGRCDREPFSSGSERRTTHMNNPSDTSISTLVDLYLRLSVQKDGSDSIERQEADLRIWAERSGLTIRKVWGDPGKSGFKNVHRAEYERAVHAVITGEVGTLATWKLDRLSRKGAGKVGTLLDNVADAGGRLYFLQDSLDSTQSGHRMVIVMVSEQARTESMNTSLRVLSKNEHAVAKGLPVGGRPRYGYRPGNRKVNLTEAAEVRRLFSDFLDGASIRSLGVRMGWRSRRVRDTLMNPSYAGYVLRGDERFEAAEEVDRIIDRDVFERVQAVLQAPGRRTSPGATIRHIASGIARCGVCDGPLSYRNNYLCLRDLGHPTIKKDYLEGRIREEMISALIYGHHKVALPGAARIHDIDIRATELINSKSELLSGVRFGVQMSDIAPQLREADRELADIQAERDQLQGQTVQSSLLRDLRRSLVNEQTRRVDMSIAAELHRTIGERYNELPLDQQRELVRGYLQVHVDAGRGPARVRIHHLEATSLNEY